MEDSQILINPTHIVATDRSVQYGDASFTTMYVERGYIVLFAQHLARLQGASEQLNIAFEQWDTLKATLSELASQQLVPSVIKVVISRGSGGRGYLPPKEQNPCCIISTHKIQAMGDNPVLGHLGVSNIVLPSHEGALELKHNNRLAQVLASQEAVAMGFDDVLMCNHNRHAIEASSSNLFYRLDGCWYAPSLTNVGVKGLMREAFIEYLSEQGIIVNQASHHVRELLSAEAMLLTNAVKGVRAVSTFKYQNNKKQLNTKLGKLTKPFLDAVLSAELCV